MSDVIPASLTNNPWPEIARAVQAGNDAADAEAALRECVEASLRINGDAEAYKRPGSLKDGERHFFVGGVFLVTAPVSFGMGFPIGSTPTAFSA